MRRHSGQHHRVNKVGVLSIDGHNVSYDAIRSDGKSALANKGIAFSPNSEYYQLS